MGLNIKNREAHLMAEELSKLAVPPIMAPFFMTNPDYLDDRR
jgi:hypothetical protein